MRYKAFTLIAVLMILSLTAPALAKPQTITVNFNQAQFQWRATAPFGAWSHSYLNSPTDETYTLTGKVLHTSWSYQPLVSDETGASTVYAYDKKAGLWIEHEGQVTYKYQPIYGEYTAVNYFRGYLKFDGAPGDDTFVHGVAYQWIYIYAPQDDAGVTDILPHAQWDSKMGAWLVGFSVYLWDPSLQSYSVPFQDPFIEPVPANDYNPLNL